MTEINTIEQWFGENNKLGIDIWNKKYRYNNETFTEWIKRVSGGDKDLAQLIIEKKFLFGGRTLTNRGTDLEGSMSNCYSSGYIEDDFKDILQVNMNLGMTYKAQGGQGVSLSRLRPKGSLVGKLGTYTSDGIVPVMKMLNQTTESSMQGGSRKGALIITISAWHKEAMTFITIKSDLNEINKANLSLEIDDEFMQIVEKDKINNTRTVVHMKQKYGSHNVEWDVIPIEIFNKMCELAWKNGEPAPIFVNRFRGYNIMQYCDDYEIETCNPCGEQPLAKNSACNLASINLSEFVINPYKKNAKFDMVKFEGAIQIAIRALDKVLDENMDKHPLQEQRDMTRNYRNVGLGIMGLGSMFFKMGIEYGSEDSITLLSRIMETMFRESIYASNNLAKELGTFPKYNPKVWDSDIIKNAFSDEEIKCLKEFGIRNCSLLSIAPSGSIGTMLNVTTGIEPAFRISYKRKTESLNDNQETIYDMYVEEAKEYMEINQGKLPDYFISSECIAWQDRVNIQAVAQNYVDTAISSTVNLPNEATIEDVGSLYIEAWKKGIKGITIFRDGCDRTGILTTETTKEETKIPEIKKELPWGTTIDADDDCIGKKRKLVTGCGSLHCTAFFDPVDGRLLETYLSKGSSGGCNNFMTSLSRMMSHAARTGASIESIVDQLMSSGTCPSYSVRTATKKDTSKGSCCPVAIGYALTDMYKEIKNELGLNEDEIGISKIKEIKKDKKNTIEQFGICPSCGEKTLIYTGNCNSCVACGYTKCE